METAMKVPNASAYWAPLEMGRRRRGGRRAGATAARGEAAGEVGRLPDFAAAFDVAALKFASRAVGGNSPALSTHPRRVRAVLNALFATLEIPVAMPRAHAAEPLLNLQRAVKKEPSERKIKNHQSLIKEL
jgi:hypothetical protein